MSAIPLSEMGLATVRWHRSFRYRDGDVSVTRLNHGWRVRTNGHEEDAASLIEAFEAAQGGRATDDDLRFILTVLASDVPDILVGWIS
jgi:hypothetical protein